MESPSVTTGPRATSRYRIWLGWVLLGLGLAGHLLAARAIGGTYLAYRDHIFGFVILLLVSGAIIAGFGWRFWRGRNDITLLTIGAVQALLGLLVYVERFRVHG
jgi:hypothetical protein